MAGWVLIALIIVVVLALSAGLAVYGLRRQGSPPPSLPEPGRDDESLGPEEHDLLDARGQELLERRIELDSIRGPLSGNTAVYDQFIALEERLRSGEIDEAEFEREKVRLLGG